ncbi:hypothetical protein DPEC_G00359170 [Dallia pectoralis]|uniref:Uncharacterized protein n=1 Tax=Dallia pectoralis TaxID=75939 RepID=A0ACC2F0G1_DALPE|nr:hypothetical protein DPEC_G00359170 [Dallia pectoralis]
MYDPLGGWRTPATGQRGERRVTAPLLSVRRRTPRAPVLKRNGIKQSEPWSTPPAEWFRMLERESLWREAIQYPGLGILRPAIPSPVEPMQRGDFIRYALRFSWCRPHVLPLEQRKTRIYDGLLRHPGNAALTAFRCWRGGWGAVAELL